MRAEGPQEYIFDEIKTMQGLRFDYAAARPARITSNTLGRRLNEWTGPGKKDCAIDELLYKPYASH
jgi:hypothetical protein